MHCIAQLFFNYFLTHLHYNINEEILSWHLIHGALVSNDTKRDPTGSSIIDKYIKRDPSNILPRFT